MIAYNYKNKNLILSNIEFFDLHQTLDCGQAFRWSKTGENSYSGIAFGRRLDLEMSKNKLILKNVSSDEYEKIWKNYFDFGRDYKKLHELFSKHGEKLKAAITFAPGIRLLQQEPWETLISFILSQNANIPRIKKMLSALCENFGDALPCGGFAFPTPEKLASLTVNDLKPINAGYRAGYILDAATRVYDGRINFTEISQITSDDAQKKLLEIRGVGTKVAECVLLFGLGRVERVPMDVWMKRVMENHYSSGFPAELQQYAGIAQQFLFHHERTKIKE